MQTRSRLSQVWCRADPGDEVAPGFERTWRQISYKITQLNLVELAKGTPYFLSSPILMGCGDVRTPFSPMLLETVKLDITNESKRPISITLPGGKKLRLGPGKTGQITLKASKHPTVQKMVEDGTVRIAQSGGSGASRSSGSGGLQNSQRRGSGSGIRKTGDR